MSVAREDIGSTSKVNREHNGPRSIQCAGGGAVAFADAQGTVSDKPLPFFLERYAEAYRLEIDYFVDALTRGTPPAPSGSDGVKALVPADAALQSVQIGRAITL